MVLFFLFKSNPLRRASIWFWHNSEHDGIDQMLPDPQSCARSTPHTNRRKYLFIALSHIGASFISLAPTFYAQIFTVSLLRAKCRAHAMPQVLFDGNIKLGYNYQHKTKKDCGGERDIRTQADIDRTQHSRHHRICTFNHLGFICSDQTTGHPLQCIYSVINLKESAFLKCRL